MINKLLIFFLTFFISIATGYAQFDSNSIPKNLLSRASATVRDENKSIWIKSPTEMVETGNRVITIHNKSGDDYGEISFYYNKSKQIKEIKGEVFDADGKSIKKFSMKDFQDQSASSESSLFDDYRVKSFQYNNINYPYTISYEFEIRHNQNLVISAWRPNFYHDLSIEKSSYKIISSPNEELRINTKNLISEAVTSSTEKQKTWEWKVENIAANRLEAYSPNRDNLCVSVEVVPHTFQYYKSKGQFNDWKSFGLWMNETLLKDKRKLPEPTIALVKEMTKDLSTDREKTKKLYEYLQTKTRYISIQVGIGGFEPFPASEVDRLGYGDCKALVNYMQALLDVVNIPSYYCIVEAGPSKIDVDPSFANIVDGNHIILCLPFEKDTTWLECTSQQMPFGYLGDFTDDRLVLACTKEGGKILRTSIYPYNENLQERTAKLVMDEKGKLSGELITKFSGTQFDNHFANYNKNKDQQIKNLKNWYNINRINFNSIHYTLDNVSEPILTETIQIDIEGYGILNDQNMTILPNVFNRTRPIPTINNRQNPVKIHRGYTDIDEIEITLPKNLIPIIKPMNKKVDSPMGQIEFSIAIQEDKMICYRKIQIKEGEYPAASYEQFNHMITETTFMDGTRYNLPLINKK